MQMTNNLRELARARRGATALLLAVGLAMLFAGSLAAQEWRGPGRIKGLVVDASGNPIEGAKVTIEWAGAEENSPSKGPQPTTTNKKGRWSYVGLTDGLWNISIEAEGQLTFEDQTTVYMQGAETLRLEMAPIPQEVIEAERRDAANEILKRGNDAAGRGEYETARAAYAEALELTPPERHAAIVVGIASTYVQENDIERATAEIDKVLALEPDNPDALRMMIAILASTGRDDEAQELLARLPDESELDPATQVNLGIMRYNEGELDEAVALFEQVVADSPDFANAYYYAGLVYLNREQNDRALERLKQYVDKAPDGEHAQEAREFVEYLEQAESAP